MPKAEMMPVRWPLPPGGSRNSSHALDGDSRGVRRLVLVLGGFLIFGECAIARSDDPLPAK